MSVQNTIISKLNEAFSPNALDVVDQSHLHQGHAGWREGGETHFKVNIVAKCFEGKGRVERSRDIYGCLADEMAGPIHALELSVKAPGE